MLKKGNLNLQAHTPVSDVSERDSAGWITVKTDRGNIKAKEVIHTTNRWASHLLPEFEKLILPDRGTLAAIKAPEGFIKHTGAQHFDSVVNVSPSNDIFSHPAPANENRTTIFSFLPRTTRSFWVAQGSS